VSTNLPATLRRPEFNTPRHLIGCHQGCRDYSQCIGQVLQENKLTRGDECCGLVNPNMLSVRPARCQRTACLMCLMEACWQREPSGSGLAPSGAWLPLGSKSDDTKTIIGSASCGGVPIPQRECRHWKIRSPSASSGKVR
jgi:hypothetical protein